MRVSFRALILVAAVPAAAGAQNLVFDDVALSSGTLDPSFGRGSAWVDLDRDGRLDLVCADAGEPNQFYRQRADGTFEDAGALWGVPMSTEYDWGTLAADFDNDGDDDLYFPNGGFEDNDQPDRPFPNQLLRNDIATVGTLSDVTAQIGDAIDVRATFGAVALDFDRDGELDILCSDRNFVTCKLLRNAGGLFFDDVSAAANIVEIGDWRHAGSADVDNDGWPDVGVGNGAGDNALYRNLGDGAFQEIAASAGVNDPVDNFGMVFQDYDNDGWQDIYVAKYQLVPLGPSPVYLNNGDLTFRNVSPGSGMGAHTDMGHESADLDGDGYPEIMMGTGNPDFKASDVLYHVLPDGVGGLTISDVSTASRFDSGGLTRQHGQALGDYDRDGDMDVYCNNGGPTWLPPSVQANFLWRNRGNTNAWTAFELQGVYSNRTGVGALGKASTSAGRDVYRTLQVGRGFSNTPDHAMHFGIGTDASIERVELTWPSGILQAIDEPVLRVYAPVVETGALVRGTPKVGGTFFIDVAGRPGDLVELAIATGTATTELDGVNGPFLLSAPYAVLPAFPLNGAGELALPIPVPNVPALVGMTFYTQAWIHGPADGGTLSQLHVLTLQ